VFGRNPDRPTEMTSQESALVDKTAKRQRKKLSTPERWELKQMMAASAISTGELPDFDEDTGILHEEDSEGDEDIEIEIVEEEPMFLRGFSRSNAVCFVVC
jgi:ATP-dependent RNA helicase DHX8/PRP22